MFCTEEHGDRREPGERIQPTPRYDDGERRTLLGIARTALHNGVHSGRSWCPDPDHLPSRLLDPRATFVTLSRRGALRGCTGSLLPREPLALSVATTTCQTALSDPRFEPVRITELDELDIEISVLSPLRLLDVRSEAELLDALRPGVDGLVFDTPHGNGTFLPKVWDSLPTPEQFLLGLKQKAGLPPDYWSDHVRVYRYETETISDSELAYGA